MSPKPEVLIPKRDEILLTAPAYTMTAAPHWIALDKGFFREEGIEVIFVFTGAVRSPRFPGKVVFGAPGVSAPFWAKPGREVINIVCTQDRPPHVLLARPGINSVAELKGKKVIAGTGTPSWIDARVALRQGGLDPDRDVQWLNSSGRTPDTERARLEALKAGEADGLASGPPHWYMAEKMGCKRFPSARDFIRWPEDGLVTRRTIIEKHPDLVKRVVRAIVRGVEFCRLHREETLDIIQRHCTYIDRDIASGCYDILRDQWCVVTDEKAYQRKIEHYCKEFKLKPRPLESYFNLRFVREVVEELKLYRA